MTHYYVILNQWTNSEIELKKHLILFTFYEWVTGETFHWSVPYLLRDDPKMNILKRGVSGWTKLKSSREISTYCKWSVLTQNRMVEKLLIIWLKYCVYSHFDDGVGAKILKLMLKYIFVILLFPTVYWNSIYLSI